MATSARPTLLNVDDDRIGRYARTRMLQRAGFTVIEAADGRSALARMRERPDLVLLDVGLPDISGFDVCRTIKSDASLQKTPVLQTSATFTTPADRARALAGGADDFIVEPVDPDVLIETVRTHLARPTAAGPSSPGHEILRGVRVLVVDDDRELLEMGRAVLEAYGAAVETTPSARGALEQIRRERPDVVVADLGMPAEDGYRLIEQIRRLPADAGGRIPAIAWTGHVRDLDRLRTLQLGYQVHLAKPSSVDDLVFAIAHLAGRSH
jgi:CheY-like chemotaxis protein